jgi:hypothetical protein
MVRVSRKIGVLYVAIGLKYLEEAFVSLRSLRRYHPSIETAVVSDLPDKAAEFFDICISLPDLPGGFGTKVFALDHSPFERTVFLDTDTFVCGDISDLFVLLEKYDLAVAPDPARAVPYILVEGVPHAFPEPNTGVIAFNKSELVLGLFSLWKKYYSAQKYKVSGWHDQPTFRRALYESAVSAVFLTPEYNARFIYPLFVAQEVKILHGRSDNLSAIAKTMNSRRWPRIYTSSILDILRLLAAFPVLRWKRGW